MSNSPPQFTAVLFVTSVLSKSFVQSHIATHWTSVGKSHSGEGMCQRLGARCVVMYSALGPVVTTTDVGLSPPAQGTHQGCPMWGMDTNKSFLYLPYIHTAENIGYYMGHSDIVDLVTNNQTLLECLTIFMFVHLTKLFSRIQLQPYDFPSLPLEWEYVPI